MEERAKFSCRHVTFVYVCTWQLYLPCMLACDVFVVSSTSWRPATCWEHLGTSLKYARLALYPQAARCAYVCIVG